MLCSKMLQCVSIFDRPGSQLSRSMPGKRSLSQELVDVSQDFRSFSLLMRTPWIERRGYLVDRRGWYGKWQMPRKQQTLCRLLHAAWDGKISCSRDSKWRGHELCRSGREKGGGFGYVMHSEVHFRRVRQKSQFWSFRTKRRRLRRSPASKRSRNGRGRGETLRGGL